MYFAFHDLPDDAHVWIYQSKRPFSAQEGDFLTNGLKVLCEQWMAHNQPLTTSFSLEHNQFVVLAVDESKLGASGCSIDGSVRFLKGMQHETSLDFFDRKWVAFLSEGDIVMHPMESLQTLFKSGTLSADSITFNNAITSKGEWQRSWKIPVRDSWLARFLPNHSG